MRRAYPRGPAQFSLGPGMMTPAVRMLIWANVGVFVAGAVIPPLGRLLIDVFGLRPQAVLTGLRIWQPVTYMFLHGGFSHILFNMLVLWMFGVQLERLWGGPFFLRYFFITGIGAGVATIGAGLLPFAFSEPTYFAVTIGASGAIYGLLMAFAIYYPNRPILMFLLFPVPAKYFVMIIGGISLLSAMNGPGGGVAHTTHLGGLIVAYLYLKGGSRTRLLAELKFHYLKWRINQTRRRFEVHEGGRSTPIDRVH